MKRTFQKIVAVLFPPFACLLWGSKRDFYVNMPCTMLLYLPGSVHALNVVCRKSINGEKSDTAKAIDDLFSFAKAGSRAGN